MNREHERPVELRDVSDALDALASRNRAAPAGLEDRLFEATRHTIASRRHTVRSGTAPFSLWQMFTPVRLAAAVAICAGAVAVWVGTLTSPSLDGRPVPHTHATADADADDLLALAWLDEGWSSLDHEIDMLRLEADAVSDSLSWELTLALEGAM